MDNLSKEAKNEIEGLHKSISFLVNLYMNNINGILHENKVPRAEGIIILSAEMEAIIETLSEFGIDFTCTITECVTQNSNTKH